MKKYILMLSIVLTTIITYAQPVAQPDTIKLAGTKPVLFNLLLNDRGTKIILYRYIINNKTYTPSNNAINISGMGTLTVRTNGTGMFTPLVSYTNGKFTYRIKDSRGRISGSTVVYILDTTQIVVIPPTPGGSLIVSNGSSQYTLSSTATTSAGVYKDGNLVRTLWNNVKRSAGTYTATWDGNNDNGVPVTGITTIKVQAHTMSYQWTANIGNSSTVDTGSHKLRGLRTPFSGVEVGNYIYMTKGNTEGNTPIYKVAKSAPSYMIEVRGGNGGAEMQTEFVCSDGNLVYWAGYDAWSGFWPNTNTTPPDTNSRVQSIIYATNVSNDLDYTFSAGKVTKPSLNGWATYSGLTILDDTAARPTGLAVMSSGNYLYSSHKGKNQVRCYNKITGALLATYTLPLAGIAIEGNTLFGIDNHNVKKYTIESNGSLTYASVSIAIGSPINISFKNGIVMAIDGATQQVKAYNTSGTILWTLGQSGGYVNSPTVANDKFQFEEFSHPLTKGYLIPSTDSSFWVGDAGNCRQLHFSKSRTFIESSSYLPTNYNAAGISEEPTRVFAGLLEYDLITKALVKNWSGNINSNYAYYALGGLFTQIFTSNGKTFGTIYYYPTVGNPDGRLREWVELTTTGLRYTGQRLQEWINYNLESDLSLYFYDGDFYAASGTGLIKRQIYNGLNGLGNPTWATATTVESFPLGIGTPYYACNSNANSKGIIFSESRQNEGYHLGRVLGGQYLWKAVKSTTPSYTGEFPTDGTFDVGNSVNLAGWTSSLIDSFLVWNYVGEFWKGAQVNKWNIFHEDGLMIMQLGKTTPEARVYSNTDDAPREAAGNALASKIVKIGADYYIIHCDESVHGAIHVFKILNANTIKIITL